MSEVDNFLSKLTNTQGNKKQTNKPQFTSIEQIENSNLPDILKEQCIRDFKEGKLILETKKEIQLEETPQSDQELKKLIVEVIKKEIKPIIVETLENYMKDKEILKDDGEFYLKAGKNTFKLNPKLLG